MTQMKTFCSVNAFGGRTAVVSRCIFAGKGDQTLCASQRILQRNFAALYLLTPRYKAKLSCAPRPLM
jgi:hypothetical protein